MKDKKHFILPILKRYINKNITLKQSNYIIHMVILISVIISAYKLLYYCKY